MTKLSSKVILFTAIAMTATAGYAADQTAVTTTTPAAVGERAPTSAVAKRTTKKKPKTRKTTEVVTPAQTPVAAVSAAQAVNPAGTTVAQAATTTEPTALAVADTSATVEKAADATSTTAVPAQAPAATRPYSFSYVGDYNAESTSLRKDGEKTFASTHYVGAAYKLSDKSKISARQYLIYNYNEAGQGKSRVSENRGETSWTTLNYGYKSAGIFGSEPIDSMFWYYVPTSFNRVGAQTGTWGILRADIVPTWTLSPKWSTSYVINPRLSMVPNRDNVWTDLDGNAKWMGTNFRMIQGPTLDYTINDKNSVGIYALVDQAFDYNDGMRMTRARKASIDTETGARSLAVTDTILQNDLVFGLGYSFSQKLSPNSTLVLYPYIEKYTAMTKDLETINPNYLAEDNLIYNITVSLSL